MATLEGNRKIGKCRGDNWRKSLIKTKSLPSKNSTLIHKKRYEQQLSQGTCALEIDISTAHYGHIEKGARPIYLKEASAIAKFFKIDFKKAFKPHPEIKEAFLAI